MVKPPRRNLSIGDDLQALDDDKELLKNMTSSQEVEYTANMSLRKPDSPDGASPEKLNLAK
jgi:apoptotic chromatin condensation inducer in the nucleus